MVNDLLANTPSWVLGIFFIVIGILFLVFRRAAAVFSYRWNKATGYKRLMKKLFGVELSVEHYEYWHFYTGLFAIVMGVVVAVILAIKGGTLGG